MSTSQWQQLNQALQQAQIGATASEVHGVLSGLICGGVTLDDRSWYAAFNDLMNDGQALPIELKQQVETLFQESSSGLTGDNLDFNLLIADDTLSLRATTMTQWVESFLAGFGVIQTRLNKAPAEVKEAIEDLSQIAQLDVEVGEDEASAQALEEIYEYVRMAAMLCFQELGNQPKTPNKNTTLH